MTESAAPSSKIWILTWGSRGDHEPAAALALGLAEKGHSAKVFGCARMRSFFDAHGVDFEALDRDVPLHTANKAAREKLCEHADDEDFTGASKVDDYWFDTNFLAYEFRSRFLLSMYVDQKPPHERLFGMLDVAKKHGDCIVGEEDVGHMPEVNTYHFHFVCQQKGTTVEDYGPVARKKRDSFRSFLKRYAQEHAFEPLDLLHRLMHAFTTYLLGLLTGVGDEDQQLKVVQEEVGAFYSWQEKADDELDAYLDKYWADWRQKLPTLEHPPVAHLVDQRGRTRNMELFYEAQPAEERPNMTISHGIAFSAGMSLYTKYQVDIVPWVPAVPARNRDEVLTTVSITGAASGAFHVLDVLQSSRQLFSISALALKEFDASKRHLRACCTGKWVLDSSLQQGKSPGSGDFGTVQEKADLDAFLAASIDDPPIYFGWGSMATTNKEALAELVVRSLQMTNKRGIIVSGWSELEQSHLDEAIAKEYGGDTQQVKAAEGRILLLKSVSHEFLFPKCACVVHHGGAGTCHAGLRAGVPAIVAPVLMDQFPNADWIESMGCGMKVSQLADLEADVLAVAISEVLGDEAMKAKANEVAGKMAEERGVPRAVELIEEWLREPAPKAAIEEGPRSWKDGMYDVFNQMFSATKLATNKVVGNTFFGADGKPGGEIRGGTFVVQEGAGEATYTVQAFCPAVRWLCYGNVNEDGTILTFTDGCSWEWTSPNPEA